MNSWKKAGCVSAVLSLFQSADAQSAFQPYNTQGDNLIHVTTADFDEVGSKDYVVGMSIEGKVISFQRPDLIVDPNSATNRLWEYQTPCSFNIMIDAGEATTNYPGDEILVPGTDGHLRIISASGSLLADWSVSAGALYCVDAGQTSSGEIRIITGGVDGQITILDENGTILSNNRPPSWGVIRRVVVGNYDGVGGDEVIAFYDNNAFSGGNYFTIIDLETLTAPSYWNPVELVVNDVQQSMGWTDKQLPHAYDMDGDGDDELVGHWGVLHPENGAGTQALSTLLTTGERLRFKEEYTDVYMDTDTGKYLLQQGIPGDFRNWSAWPGPEMLTIYGDDLYLVDYDLTESANNRFRVKDYGYAHTLYHFTDGARLESRSGGLDKIVLAGPPNGDDHFYVVDLNSNDWKSQAKTIDGNGVLGTVRNTLDDLEADITAFAGAKAEAGEPIWYVDYFAGYLGTWDKTDPGLVAARADEVVAAMDEWTDELFGIGYEPQRIYLTASISPAANGTTVQPAATNGLENVAAALAQRGAHFCLNIGKGPNLYISPDHLADIFEASIHNGHCYMMARTKELSEAHDIDVYKPHMDAVIARAFTLGVAPPKIMICTKGAVFSIMTPSQASTYFPAYKDVFVPGVENSNVSDLDWSFAERAGLWLNGDVESWGCNSIGDNLTPNRVTEFGGMRNGHVVLRHLLSQYALGADVYRITSIQGKMNPLYERDGTGPEYSSAYRQGIFNFLKMVEAGIYPNTPHRSQLKGVSPVAAALYQPNYARLRQLTYNHNYKDYSAPTQDYVINHLACWDAYRDVPDVDLTAIMLNNRRRWDNLLPTSPCGFVPVIPYADRAELEANAWCTRAYQTDGDHWDEFQSLETARDTIVAELVAQRTNMMFYADGECFWQVTQNQADPDTLFVVLMDSNTLTPTDRTVQFTKGAAAGTWLVYDQFGSQTEPLATLVDSGEGVSLDIPAGGLRLLMLKKLQPIAESVLGIAWDGEVEPALAVYGINGVITPGGQGIRAAASSTDGTFGGYAGASAEVNGAYEVRGVEHSTAKSRISVAVTNNTGSTIQLESLEFDVGRWFDDSPTNVTVSYLSGDLTVTNNTSLATVTVSNILGWAADYEDFSVGLTNLSDSTLAHGEHAVFRLEGSEANGQYTGGGIDNVGIVVSGFANYDAWAASFGLYASNAWKTADLEPDGMDNWTEYIFGGDPNSDDASSILPTSGIVPILGTNWLEYVYCRRNDYQTRGLNYTVEATTNLASGTWSASAVIDVGYGAVDAEMDSVTNRVLTEEPEQFIRLKVSE
ncbi:Lambda-carrageenase [Pontiella desulfatans]|uniref:Lambda-carrageenase n=1 Tax=Pontiella desulfatans TaxID=2750659 RepID=A0A6C2U8H2_PONDE|nr:hypothetical protein [Pontiella desulfatans]VGO16412.1 Lambda-carrageenase [Pontiella desulfatans]